ncbi:MAG: hypothetical protein J6Y37_14380 [Paludibacteraceae bacterium]|nr:hypothetical protein [Paludibacteraceae bacterium]
MERMQTDELLKLLPSHVGRNPIRDDDGKIVAYCSDDRDGGDIGWLYLHNDGNGWVASYGVQGEYVCMNPDDDDPPYNNAVAYGDTPNEALRCLYDWCVENGFVCGDDTALEKKH